MWERIRQLNWLSPKCPKYELVWWRTTHIWLSRIYIKRKERRGRNQKNIAQKIQNIHEYLKKFKEDRSGDKLITIYLRKLSTRSWASLWAAVGNGRVLRTSPFSSSTPLSLPRLSSSVVATHGTTSNFPRASHKHHRHCLRLQVCNLVYQRRICDY